MAKYSHIGQGGVGAPVGLTVFKTAEGSLKRGPWWVRLPYASAQYSVKKMLCRLL
jgi:hypothetical protein